MSTLVLCIDRGGSFGRETPIVGERAVSELVTAVGVDDPENSRVNCLLETLHVARELREENDEAVVAVVSSTGESVSVDRDIARQIDDLVADYGPTSAVVVVDSAEDEQAVPIVESRMRVDAVDRVIVRQARDIESTYYLLKQLLADEELRSTVLVPLGAALLAIPLILTVSDSVTITIAVVAAAIGVFFLYKGLGVDDLLAGVPGTIQNAFYSGQVSLVTYVVGVGLALVGLFAGAIGVTEMDPGVLMAVRFVFASVPWFALAALVASTGRLFDALIGEERVRSALLNLPFGVVAVGLVVRGFSAFFLETAAVIEPFEIPAAAVGPLVVRGFVLASGTRLAVLVVAGVLVSLFGVGFSSYVTALTVEDDLSEQH